MAKRQRTRRVTPTVQGVDSFVEIRELTVGEAKVFQRERERLDAKQRRLQAQRAQLQEAADLNGEAAEMDAQIADLIEEVNQTANKALAEMVIAWDWVDDDDNPLPQPHNNPDVLDLLIPSEVEFIVDALKGEGDEKKVRKLR